MGIFSYENQGTNTYLVYELGAEDAVDSMSLGMLTNNKIAGFAPASYTQIDTAKYIKFNVSAKVSAAQLFTGPVNRKRLLGVFSGIVGAMLSAEDYMLDANNLLLDLSYIYSDVSTCETVLVCLPVINAQRKNPEPSAFFKSIIFNTQFDQTENCDYVAQILNYLNSNPVLALGDFKVLLERLKGMSAQPTRNAPVAAPAPVTAPVQPQPVVRQPTVPTPPAANREAVPAANHKFDNLQFGANYTPTQPNATHPTQPPRNTAQPSVPRQPQKPPVQPQQYAQPAQPPMGAVAQQSPDEKPMSMFYLLQHYNKDNAALYKAQKESKKAAKGNGDMPMTPPMQQPAPQKQPNVGFAVPGKQNDAPASFAIPGQQNAPTSFAVPGRQESIVPPTPQIPPVQKAQPSKPAARQPVQPQQPIPTYQPPVQQPAAPINFGETTVLGGGAIGETTVLSATVTQQKVEPYLVRIKNNERIPLNKPVFRIGKERSYVDYFVSDNTAISRSHANIINRNGEFFVVDTNSTNHTYVDGRMIQSNVETKLTHGARLKLANEDFEFNMY